MRKGLLVGSKAKSLPFSIYAAIRDRREVFGTENPYTFDYVCGEQGHYRLVLAFYQDEVAPEQYILRDMMHVEYSAKAGQPLRWFTLYDADYDCVVDAFNGCRRPVMAIDCVRAWAYRDADRRVTHLDVGLAFTVGGHTYAVSVVLVLRDKDVTRNRAMVSPTFLHAYLMNQLDEALFGRLSACCGAYVARTLCGEGKSRLSSLMRISTDQAKARQASEWLWGDLVARRKARFIKLDFESASVRGKRQISLWGLPGQEVRHGAE